MKLEIGKRYFVRGDDCCVRARFTARCVEIGNGDGEQTDWSFDNGVRIEGFGWEAGEIVTEQCWCPAEDRETCCNPGDCHCAPIEGEEGDETLLLAKWEDNGGTIDEP